MSDELMPVSVRRSPWHIYPADWKPEHWLVPYLGENAVIQHGHTDADDHSLCGPTVACCAKAQQLFVEAFPESAAGRAAWELTSAEHIAAWMDAGVKVVYFVFCDPVRPEGLLAGGLMEEEARQVLFRRVHLEGFADRASRLR
jgi:hypothetical protein